MIEFGKKRVRSRLTSFRIPQPSCFGFFYSLRMDYNGEDRASATENLSAGITPGNNTGGSCIEALQPTGNFTIPFCFCINIDDRIKTLQ